MNHLNSTFNGLAVAPSSPAKTEKGNPTLMIQNQLQAMRAAREKTISTIYSLEQEKKTIEQILPKIYYELQKIQDKIASEIQEANIYSNAITEIEQNYGEFIYSAHFFDNDDQ
mmetsp:Transcript_4607/g.5044  ORF Transcript_4607/g.5044 Transcript_4607/m.5044 type:complete len:113 (+) Transcript_4607:59-397(+)